MEFIAVRRKPLEGRAIRITEQNIADVAEWVGSYPMVDRTKGLQRTCVRVLEAVVMGNPKYTKAYIGDWITESMGTFQRHDNRTFRRRFDEVPDEEGDS
jgi:hypothetical protein